MRKIIEGAPAKVGHYPKVFVGSLLATVSHLARGFEHDGKVAPSISRSLFPGSPAWNQPISLP